jgi:hypothetical protein
MRRWRRADTGTSRRNSERDAAASHRGEASATSTEPVHIGRLSGQSRRPAVVWAGREMPEPSDAEGLRSGSANADEGGGSGHCGSISSAVAAIRARPTSGAGASVARRRRFILPSRVKMPIEAIRLNEPNMSRGGSAYHSFGRSKTRMSADLIAKVRAVRGRDRASEAPANDELEPLAEVVQLAGSLPGGFVLQHPLRAEVWIEQGEYVADAPELNVHAFGATRAEALDNLRAAIVEQRSRLLSNRPHLSQFMEGEAVRLEALVLPRSA